MKFLCLSIWAGQQIKEKYQNGCHLKTTSQNHYLMCICGVTHVHRYTKYEVSMSNSVAGRGVHR